MANLCVSVDGVMRVPPQVLQKKYDGGRGVQKFKDIIFGSCVWLYGVIFKYEYLLGYEFDVMAVWEAVCAFY